MKITTYDQALDMMRRNVDPYIIATFITLFIGEDASDA